jgi:hypothetical protein
MWPSLGRAVTGPIRTLADSEPQQNMGAESNEKRGVATQLTACAQSHSWAPASEEKMSG